MSKPKFLYEALILFDYEAQEKTELTVARGQIAAVREVNPEGWCLVKVNGKSGWIPLSYTETLEPIKEAAAAHHRATSSAAPLSPDDMKQLAAAAAASSPPLAAPADKPAAAPEPAPLPAAAAPAGGAASAPGGSHEICHACKDPILERFVMAKDKTYHIQHFLCSVCKKEMAGLPFLEKDDVLYCEDHFYAKFNPPCAYCNDVIKGKYVTALGQSWHPEHFVCAECAQPFSGPQFRKHDDKPYCEEHYNKLFGTYCTKCNQIINDNKAFEALGKKFHVDCFVCECGAHPIGENNQFHVYEEKVYCVQHFEELFLEKCTKCTKPIMSTYIKVLGQLLHPECWQCESCNVVINRRNYEQYMGTFLCSDCFINRSSAAPQGPAPAARLSDASERPPSPSTKIAPAPPSLADSDSKTDPDSKADTPAGVSIEHPPEPHRPPSAVAGIYIPASVALPTPALHDLMQQQNLKAGLLLTNGPLPGISRGATPLGAQAKKGFQSVQHDASLAGVAHVIASKSEAFRQAWSKRISLTAKPEVKSSNFAAGSASGFQPSLAPVVEEGEFVAYPLLKSGPLPPHIDPTKKEQHLSDNVFERMFKMTKAEFAKLKGWKQKRLKESVGLW